MLILGIETSCDETAAAVVEDGRVVRSNVIASQDDLHAEYAGVVPEIASRAHVERILPVVRRAVADAGVHLPDLDAVAVGHRPGLIGSLLVGVAAAKALAWSLGKPLIGVDHVHAHLYAGWLEVPEQKAPSSTHKAQSKPGTQHETRTQDSGPGTQDFPALGLVVSGGHTTMYRCSSAIDFERLGGTIDDALGEAFDKAATILGLPYPGGPNLDRLAQRPDADDRAHDFPVSRLSPDSLDFSFSGLKTSLLYAVRGKPLPGGQFERDHTWMSEATRADFAASFQRAAVQAVLLKLERAVARGPGGTGFQTLLVGGGVTANSRLRRELTGFADAHGLRIRLPALRFCMDNAAMIAGIGYPLLRAGRTSGLDLAAVPTTAC
jgi:N6-L-threonylcarbamoyladenine synthase